MIFCMELRYIARNAGKLALIAGAAYLAVDYIRGEPVEDNVLNFGESVLSDLARDFRIMHVVGAGAAVWGIAKVARGILPEKAGYHAKSPEERILQ